jgi:hypothetical protein
MHFSGAESSLSVSTRSSPVSMMLPGTTPGSHSPNAIALAFGTFFRSSGSEGQIPTVSASGAMKCSNAFHSEVTSVNSQGLAVDERARHFAARRFNDPSERLPGDPHPFRGGIVVKAVEIRETKGFQFFHGERDVLQLLHRDALWFE